MLSYYRDSVEGTRSQASAILGSLLDCIDAVSPPIAEFSALATQLVDKIMQCDWHVRGRYALLESIVVRNDGYKILHNNKQLQSDLIKCADVGDLQSVSTAVYCAYLKVRTVIETLFIGSLSFRAFQNS